MSLKSFCVIGARGFVGKTVIAALRVVYPDCHIVATSSRKAATIPGADQVINVEITPKSVRDESWIEPLACLRPFDATFYCLAFSRAVGVPPKKVSTKQRRTAYLYSVKSMETMERWGGFGKLWFFSSFLWLRVVHDFYGAIFNAKVRLESRCRELPSGRQLIRFGAAEDSSLLRGVAVAVLRRLKSGTLDGNRLFPALTTYSRDTVFAELLKRVRDEEREAFATDGLTTTSDLQEAIEACLRNAIPGARNVVRDLHWMGDDKPNVRLIRALRELSAGWRQIFNAGDASEGLPVSGEYIPMPVMM